MKSLKEIIERDVIVATLRREIGKMGRPYKHPHRDVFVRTADKILEIKYNHRNPADVAKMRKEAFALLEEMFERVSARKPRK